MISADLEKIIGPGPHSPIILTKKLWEYIRKRDLLRDTRPPMRIRPDKDLAMVLATKRDVDMFELTRGVNRHIRPEKRSVDRTVTSSQKQHPARRRDKDTGVKSLPTLPAPRAAWLLVADEASFYTELMLRHALRDYLAGRRPYCWTCSPRVEIGDLMFVYFMAPRKAIHFVCRATSRPYVDHHAIVRSDRDISKYQWLVEVSPPVEIEPITFDEIRVAVGGYLNLAGRTGKYVETGVANHLIKIAKVRFTPSEDLARQILQFSVGRSELPRPGSMTFAQWREIPSAMLKIEREVEIYIVEPLLRFCGIPKGSLDAVRQTRTPTGVPDYVIKKNGNVTAVIEVKQRVASPRTMPKNRWKDSRDHRQLCRYSTHFGCHGILVDCDQIFLFSGPRMGFIRRYDRRSMTLRDIASIRRFFVYPGTTPGLG